MKFKGKLSFFGNLGELWEILNLGELWEICLGEPSESASGGTAGGERTERRLYILSKNPLKLGAHVPCGRRFHWSSKRNAIPVSGETRSTTEVDFSSLGEVWKTSTSTACTGVTLSLWQPRSNFEGLTRFTRASGCWFGEGDVFAKSCRSCEMFWKLLKVWLILSHVLTHIKRCLARPHVAGWMASDLHNQPHIYIPHWRRAATPTFASFPSPFRHQIATQHDGGPPRRRPAVVLDCDLVAKRRCKSRKC